MIKSLDSQQGHIMISTLTEQPIPTPRMLRHGTFKATRDQVALARRLTQETLANHPAVDVAVLLVSELTTNCVQHSGSSFFTVVIARTLDCTLHINVIDEGCKGLPHLHYGELEDERGRGIRLVDQFAKRWGITREQGAGMAVWFALDGHTV
jgi:anti-sigma regulatory factor (Ser/Thr protein kinase)